MSTLDELFKQKLEDHTLMPSAEAWQKVEAGLSRRRNPLVWLRWAAVLLLGGLLIGTLWLQKETPAVVLSQKKENTPIQIETPATKEVQTPHEVKQVQQAALQRKINPVKSSPPLVTQEVMAPENTVPQPVVEEITASVAVVSPSIVLTYTLDPIEIKTTEATSPTITASTQKKDNSLKRAMKFAQNVKNSDAPLSELRVMKEELFALDFKKKTSSKKQ